MPPRWKLHPAQAEGAKTLLWIVTVFVLLAAASPYVMEALF
jgi:hypothetical protein